MKHHIFLLTGFLICCYASGNGTIALPARGGGEFRVLIPDSGEKPLNRDDAPAYTISDKLRFGFVLSDNSATVSRAPRDTEPRKTGTFLLTIASGLLLLSAAGLCAFLRQRRVISQLQERHAKDSDRIRELDNQLSTITLRHETAVRELATANSTKDKYLCYYIQRSTFYINKLDRHRTHLYKTALSYGQERLLRELRSPTPVEQEYKSFFHEFDRVFLSLYPDFVEKANLLLRETEQMKTPGLNTEFRLLAVIRLGITGNNEIAHLLHISINTVYTYRNRLRNAAKCPPAEFEQRIREIV